MLNLTIFRKTGPWCLFICNDYFIASLYIHKDESIIFTVSMKCLLFVCLFRVHRQTQAFWLTWRSHHYRWRAANFDLCSVNIEQWRFVSVTHLLCHWASDYNIYLWGHVTLALIAERLAVELSQPVFTT